MPEKRYRDHKAYQGGRKANHGKADDEEYPYCYRALVTQDRIDAGHNGGDRIGIYSSGLLIGSDHANALINGKCGQDYIPTERLEPRFHGHKCVAKQNHVRQMKTLRARLLGPNISL
jgi:hypothetical protein